ncbi:hypothetical protein [Candidatus Thiosymbion oneisti]|uniref:hypothetical protein n=1 Tax=Candidatus Thiosymbion oneisti TaxID=589554 RepID=UPI000B7F1303|nr:hypothetical protein [Candidatus Thiosymbion oneisti]
MTAELVLIIAGVGDLVMHDELMFVIHTAWYVVAGDVLVALVQGPRIGVGTRALGLTAFL